MKLNQAIIGLIISLAVLLGGCGGNKGGEPAAGPAAEPAGVRSAASGAGTNVSKIGAYTGAAPGGVVVRGSYAYVIADTGLLIFNVSNPAAPSLVGEWHASTSAMDEIYISGNYAYLTDKSEGLFIIDITAPSNPALAGHYKPAGSTHSVSVSGNYAFITVDSVGLQIINVLNPASPALAGAYAMPGSLFGGTPRSLCVSGNYAYVTEGIYGLLIINVSNPANPALAGSYSSVSNVVISGNYLYGFTSNGLTIYNITNPVNPVLTGSVNNPQIAIPKDLYVSGNYAYISDLHGLMIFDVSNPASPVYRSYFEQGGRISGQGDGLGVYVSGNYAYMVCPDNGYSRLQIINITNPLAPELASNYYTADGISDIYVSGNYIYAGVEGLGLAVFDATNPTNPALAIRYSLLNRVHGLFVSANHAYIANESAGLKILNVTNPLNPAPAGSYDTPGDALGVYVSGNYAYVADGSSGLQIINVANPLSPALAGTYDTPGNANSVFVSGNYAYVADGSSGMQIINVTNPASPALAGTYNTPGYAIDVFVSGNYAYVADGASGLQIINVANPANPLLAGNYVMSGVSKAVDVYVSGNYAYVAHDAYHLISLPEITDGLQIINVSDPANPSPSGNYPRSGLSVFVYAGKVFLAGESSELSILNFTSAAGNRPPVVSSCAFTPYSVPAGGTVSSTLQCNVADPDNNVSAVKVNLSSIGGSTATTLTNTSGTTWRLTGVIPPATATVRTNYPVITATDAYGATGTSQATLAVKAYVPPANPKPVVSGCGFTPYSLAAGGTASSTLQCTVTDANNNLSTVTVDLSSIGGSTTAALTNTASNTWRLTGITPPATATVRTNYPKITATDALGATGTTQATLIVTAYIPPPNPKPVVSGCSFTPYRLGAGTATTSTLQCTVTDANNNLSTVTANLTALGGPANSALTNMGANTWRRAGITAMAASTVGTNYPKITATDALGATGTSQATMIVYDPAPVLSYCAFSPSSVRSNGVAATTVQCTVNDINNNVSTVTVNLSAIGGAANAALTNMGGGVWRRTGITAAIGTAAGTKYPTTTATDASSGTGSQAATLIVYP